MGRIYYNSNGVILENSKILFDGTDSIVDIYYGDGPTKYPDYLWKPSEEWILNNFNTTTGFVGSPSGRTYTFSTGYTHKYFCIPFDPNTGERVIKEVRKTFQNKHIMLSYGVDYPYSQENPSPTNEVYYGEIIINNNKYRIYETLSMWSGEQDRQLTVYSF